MLYSAPHWQKIPCFAISSFYFCYFGVVGILLPYWTVFLHSLGYDAREIGSLMAILMMTRLVAPYSWAWLIDNAYLGFSRLQWVQLGALGAAISFIGVWLAQGYWQLAVMMGFFGLFWNAFAPQMEVIVFDHLGTENMHRYSQLRIWGSIGFIVTVLMVGILLRFVSNQWLPAIMFATLIGCWLSSLLIFEKHIVHDSENAQGLWDIISQTSVIALFMVLLLNQASHGVYYTFYSIYLAQHGYSSAIIGQLWALGVVAEIVLFLCTPWLLKQFPLRQLFAVSLLLAALRWSVIGYWVESLELLIIAQLFHAASFGLYHVVAVQFIKQYFTGRLQGQGQALFSTVSYGAGGAIGAYGSGWLWESAGAVMTFNIAAVLCVLAAGLTWEAVGRQKNA